MDDDPPFVGWDDADAATVVGTSCPLPGSIILVAPLKTGENNPTIFLQFCKDWKNGRLEGRKIGSFTTNISPPHGDAGYARLQGLCGWTGTAAWGWGRYRCFCGVRANRMGMRLLQTVLWVGGPAAWGCGGYRRFGRSLGRPLRMRRLRAFLLRSFLTQGHFLYKLGEK
jgi:hypothetical protein